MTLRRDIFSMIENPIPPWVALRRIDENASYLGTASHNMVIEDGTGSSNSNASPMEVSGAIVPHPSNLVNEYH